MEVQYPLIYVYLAELHRKIKYCSLIFITSHESGKIDDHNRHVYKSLFFK